MTSFTIIAALMLLLAIVLLLRPLLRSPEKNNIDQKSLNLDIYKQHLQELDADLDSGLITQEDYASAQQDLEKQLIIDVPDTPKESIEDKQRSPFSQIAIVIIIPVVTIGLYLYLGSPDTLDTPPATQMNSADAHANAKANKSAKALPSVPEMIVKLEEKVAQEPKNIQGWELLSRSYMHTRQFEKAEKAFQTLTELKIDDPNLWADYADIAAVNRNGKLEGKPFEFTKRALSLQPKHPKALWLAGTYHFQKNNYTTAIRFWEILKSLLPPESKDAAMITAGINDARKRLGLPIESAPAIANSEPAAVSSLSIKGKVMLAKTLTDKASPTDTVFVYARASKGPRMPLAVVKKQVKDLPFEFTLDDSMAMMPQMKLSNFETVVITARISKSGNAITQSGDLIAKGINITTKNSSPVTLEINSVTP
ncbi:MAG: c-type cytochrome biogenesis protein CcmI [Gammaproteobacteria bacterium]|nr:c-type cytochrome biogenesis protein CcmI [Gammaproteobacteria bacterium]